MPDLLNLLEAVPIGILLVEIVAAVYVSRRRGQRSLFLVLGSYLIFVALAFALGFFSRDEFGFSWIPLVFITGPWEFLVAKLPGSLLTKLPPSWNGNHYGIFLLGALLNCVIFYGIGRLSYPNHSTRTAGSACDGLKDQRVVSSPAVRPDRTTSLISGA